MNSNCRFNILSGSAFYFREKYYIMSESNNCAERAVNMNKNNEQKDKIRSRYKGIDSSQLEIIPALPKNDIYNTDRELRVAVYVRVSTGDPRQTSSYELQKNHYKDYVAQHKNWRLLDIYADEGISGTSLQHRDEFIRMINDCKDGKIDLILVKSISRFARNQVDFGNYVRNLKKRDPPIGVIFESEGINSLDPVFEMAMSMLSVLAQEESHIKSEVMNTSVEMRFKRGIFLTPELFGYDLDDNGELVINENEAKIVKLIFFMYLYGYSSSEIAETLTRYNIKTPKGNKIWSSGSIINILKNERHCGDVTARKTWTPDYLDHRSRKNRQDRNQYKQTDHHEAIVSRADFIAVQKLIDNAKYGNKGILPELKVISEGAFKGFVTIHRKWAGFKAADYIQASESVYSDIENASDEKPNSQKSIFDLSGYEIARSQFFDVPEKLTVVISVSHIMFSVFCIRKMNCAPYIEILIEPVKGLLAIRKSDKSVKNSIAWTTIKEKGATPKSIGGKAFLKTIFEIMSWNIDYKYRLSGAIINNEAHETAITFDLREPEILIPNSAIGLRSDETEASEVKTAPVCGTSKSICAYPKEWTDSFGYEYYSHSSGNLSDGLRFNGADKTFIDEKACTTDKSIIKETIDAILSLPKEEQNEQ